MFFSFDGIDGTGKSTQMDRFCGHLRQLGYEVVTCRDPGSTPLGERLRDILLDHGDFQIHMVSEMLIYMAARAQLVSEVVRPTLARGAVVVCDRYLLANVAYQGHGGQLPPDMIWSVGQVATGGCLPTLTLLLDLDVETAAARIGREPDRLEARGLEYFQRVRDGFLTEAARLGPQVAVINADQAADDVFAQVLQATAPWIGKENA
jgi:dTMP kinase